MTLDTRCPHEKDGARADQTVSDHKPLTVDQIREMLTQAVTADAQLFSRIQMRLNQGIKGITCPRPAIGKVAQVMSTINLEYVEARKRAPETLLKLAKRFYRLMHGG